ncbi:MAG: response regulator receiver modulated diguanylate cyclase [Deltaproteobacteria bacterium]|nr:response regulator receiver modulated diguanylate cyclase [Deltaproteobacteria bacterium]
MSKGRILVVDDSRLSRTLCTDILAADGFDVETASTGMEALNLLKARDFDLVILDMILPDISGQEVLHRSKQIKASTNFIVLTGHASLDSAIECLKSGASDYLTKPLNPEEFKIIVNRSIEQKRLFEENSGLKRLTRLYELSTVISTCLDKERFYEVVLDSMLQIINGKVGISISYDREPVDWHLKAFRATDEETAKNLADALISYLKLPESETGLSGRHEIMNLELKVLVGLPYSDMGPLLLVPISQNDSIAGYLAIFSELNGSYNNLDIENASFIANQATLALENIQLYSQASELTYIDDLTKLHNIRYMDIALENEIKRAKRFNGHLCFLFLDIDYFKSINDSYGHQIGSKVLIELGRILKEIVREIDTVARYGGDEFTILLVETNAAGATVIANRLRDIVEKHPFMTEEGLSIRLTITIGVAAYPEQASSKQELLTAADKAMYKGKNTTRNIVILAEEKTD